MSVRMAGFEPTLSSIPSWRISKLSHILIGVAIQVARAAFHTSNGLGSGGGRESNPTHSVYSRTYPVCKLLPLGTATQSVQRELNPHVYHGKVAGYRYIMDAGSRSQRVNGSTCPASAS